MAFPYGATVRDNVCLYLDRMFDVGSTEWLEFLKKNVTFRYYPGVCSHKQEFITFRVRSKKTRPCWYCQKQVNRKRREILIGDFSELEDSTDLKRFHERMLVDERTFTRKQIYNEDEAPYRNRPTHFREVKMRLADIKYSMDSGEPGYLIEDASELVQRLDALIESL